MFFIKEGLMEKGLFSVFKEKLISFLLLLFILSGNSWSQVALEPKVSTDEDKIKFLIYITQTVPDLFSQTINYDHDVFDLLERYRIKLEELKSDPQYSSLKHLSENRKKVIISEEVIGSKDDINKKITANLSIDESFIQTLEQLISINSLNFTSGLSAVLPETQRKEFFPLSMKEKLLYLENHLPEDLIANGFKPTLFGIDSKNYTKKMALTNLKNIIQEEENLKNKIASIFPDETNAKQIIKILIEEKQINLDKKAAEKLVSRLLPNATKDDVTKQKKVLFELEEQTSEHSLFRGFIGGDCSSSHSGLYALLPTERSFYIYQNGKAIGTITGTMITVNKEAAFYLHSINGANISPKDIKVFISGINELLKSENIHKLILPNDNQRFSLVNSSIHRDELQRISYGLKLVNINHLDSNIRARIDSTTNSSYDRVTSNSTGYLLNMDKLQDPKIKSEINIIKYKYDPSNAIRKSLIISLIQSLVKIKKTTEARRILAAYGLDYQQVITFNQFAQNPNRLPIDEFFKKLNELASEIGITEDPKWKEELKPSLNIATMLAKDAFAEANLKSTIKLVISEIKNSTFGEQTAYFLIKEKNDLFASNDIFQTFLNNLAFGSEKQFSLYESIISKIPSEVSKKSKMSLAFANARESSLEIFLRVNKIFPSSKDTIEALIIENFKKQDKNLIDYLISIQATHLLIDSNSIINYVRNPGTYPSFKDFPKDAKNVFFNLLIDRPNLLSLIPTKEYEIFVQNYLGNPLSKELLLQKIELLADKKNYNTHINSLLNFLVEKYSSTSTATEMIDLYAKVYKSSSNRFLIESLELFPDLEQKKEAFKYIKEKYSSALSPNLRQDIELVSAANSWSELAEYIQKNKKSISPIAFELAMSTSNLKFSVNPITRIQAFSSMTKDSRLESGIKIMVLFEALKEEKSKNKLFNWKYLRLKESVKSELLNYYHEAASLDQHNRSLEASALISLLYDPKTNTDDTILIDITRSQIANLPKKVVNYLEGALMVSGPFTLISAITFVGLPELANIINHTQHQIPLNNLLAAGMMSLGTSFIEQPLRKIIYKRNFEVFPERNKLAMDMHSKVQNLASNKSKINLCISRYK